MTTALESFTEFIDFVTKINVSKMRPFNFLPCKVTLIKFAIALTEILRSCQALINE